MHMAIETSATLDTMSAPCRLGCMPPMPSCPRQASANSHCSVLCTSAHACQHAAALKCLLRSLCHLLYLLVDRTRTASDYAWRTCLGAYGCLTMFQ
jgi:hypothetical protein